MSIVRTVGVVVFNLAVSTAFLAAYLDDPARFEAGVALRWMLLLIVAIAYPLWWTREHYSTFRRLGVAIDGKAYALAWSPVWVGGTTLLIALTVF